MKYLLNGALGRAGHVLGFVDYQTRLRANYYEVVSGTPVARRHDGRQPGSRWRR
jgi:hypothetical protein